MIGAKDIMEMHEITERVFVLGEGYVAKLLSEDIQHREFEILSIDLASRLSYLAELIAHFADEFGMSDYAKRFEESQWFVSEAAKMYLDPLYKDKK